MSFKENIRTKIRIDLLVQTLSVTIRDTPGNRYLDKNLMRELLCMTDFKHMQVRDLDLYVRSLEGEINEVLVFDNELAIYHTTVSDAAMRKSPNWKEMFSIRNIRKILNDQDVVVSKGRESLKRVHANALALLDLSCTAEDIEALVAEARLDWEQKSLLRIQESFDVFFELLDFQPVSLGVLEHDVQAFARPKADGERAREYEHLILFDRDNLWVRLMKGKFLPQRDLDLARAMQCARGEVAPDLEGTQVFQFLAELALKIGH